MLLGEETEWGGNKKVDFSSAESKIHTEKMARKNLDLIPRANRRHCEILRRRREKKD